MKKMSLEGRIAQKTVVCPSTGCHLWTGAKDKSGFGLIKVPNEKRQMLVHRYMYSQVVGPQSIQGLMVLHKCTNNSCINPQHLTVGSLADKAVLNASKGKPTGWQACKLTPEQVREIRANPNKALKHFAYKFDVAPATIWHVVHGRTWKNIR